MHMGSVECLVLCLQLWLATSYSEIITKQMDNVVSCEGGKGEFPWNDDTKPLLKVEYYFQNKIIAKSSRPNFSSVVYKDENLKSRLLKDDNIAFRIEHVTEKDRGEYKIVLTYTDGDRLELVGSLDVTVPGSGKLNITRETNSSNVFRCGEQTGSDLYTWVFTKATGVDDRDTKESELTLDCLPKNGSFYCVRLSDCQRSPWFNFTLGVTGRRRKRATSGVDEPFSCDADEQPPASDSSTGAIIGIVVTACIVGTVAVVVGIVIKRKRNSRTEQESAGPDGNCSEETGPESHKLVGIEDQTRQPEEAGPDSHEPIKQVDKTHQPDKQTCERMNLTQTC